MMFSEDGYDEYTPGNHDEFNHKPGQMVGLWGIANRTAKLGLGLSHFSDLECPGFTGANAGCCSVTPSARAI